MNHDFMNRASFPSLSICTPGISLSYFYLCREQQLSARHRQAFLSNEDAPPTTQLSVNGPAGTRTGNTRQVGAGSQASPKGTHITYSNSVDRLSGSWLKMTTYQYFPVTSVMCAYDICFAMGHIHVVVLAGSQTKQLPVVYWPLYWKLNSLLNSLRASW